MNPLLEDIQLLMTRELAALAKEIEMFPDDASIWRTVPGVANPAGVLARHVCGNLQHFVGGVLGHTGYVRDRENEFNDHSATRQAVIAEIRATMEVVSTVMAKLDENVLAEGFPLPPVKITVTGRRFLLHLCTHAAFHLGQAGYLRRMLTGDPQSSGGLSVNGLMG